MKLTKTGVAILMSIANGNTTTEDFSGSKARSLSALRKGRLVSVTPIKVEGLKLTPAGQEILEGSGSPAKSSKSNKIAHGRRNTSTGHRVGSTRSKAFKMIEQYSGKIARGALIEKLVAKFGTSPNTASTYIHQAVSGK